MQQTISAAPTQSKPRPRNWLILLDIAFYLALTAFLVWLVYYFYTYRSIIVLDVPFMLQGAVTTIVLSLTSMIFATIFGFIRGSGARHADPGAALFLGLRGKRRVEPDRL
jgi:hypothetical protein